MRDPDELFVALARSKFRSRFRLGVKETSYLNEKTLAVVLEHGSASSSSGRLMPNRGTTVGRHRCGGILSSSPSMPRLPEGQPLTPEQIDYIIAVLARWLEKQRIRS